RSPGPGRHRLRRTSTPWAGPLLPPCRPARISSPLHRVAGGGLRAVASGTPESPGRARARGRRLTNTSGLAWRVRPSSLHGPARRTYAGLEEEDRRGASTTVRPVHPSTARGPWVDPERAGGSGQPCGGQRPPHRARTAEPLPAERVQARARHGDLAAFAVRG